MTHDNHPDTVCLGCGQLPYRCLCLTWEDDDSAETDTVTEDGADAGFAKEGISELTRASTIRAKRTDLFGFTLTARATSTQP